VLCSKDGKVLVAGKNDSGQLGFNFLGKLPYSLFFGLSIPGNPKISTISCGFDHTVSDFVLFYRNDLN
jgi:hypothetical protein